MFTIDYNIVNLEEMQYILLDHPDAVLSADHQQIRIKTVGDLK